MAESSLFAQRLQAITERRRLQERILATRRELEEERLRAQRLKRKSLRDRWLMEGALMPADDKDHMSSIWEAQTRIQGLEQDLSSLQSQMLQLDNMDLPQGQQQQKEVSVKAFKEVKQASLDGIVEIAGMLASSPEGRNITESTPELASVPPKKLVQAAAKEKLENGDMSGDGIFGSECGSEKAGGEGNSVVIEDGDRQSPQGRPKASPAMKNLDSNEAAAGHQRKLAVEEMVIRDHLGQEVGSMDAVGLKQSFIRKEEELGEHNNVGNDCEEWSRPDLLCNTEEQEKACCATESHLDNDLGNRDGPEGESSISHDQQNHSSLLQDKTSCLDSPKRQADGELGIISLVKEALLVEEGQKEPQEQNRKESEPTRDLTAGDFAVEEAVTGRQANHTKTAGAQKCHGSETIMVAEPGEKGETLWDQTKPCVPDQVPPTQETKILYVLEEAELPLPDPLVASSVLSEIPSLPDTKGSLLEQNLETKSSLLEPEQALLPNLDQSLSLHDSKSPLLVQTPSSLPESFIELKPPSLEDHFSSPSEQKVFILQGGATSHKTKYLLDKIPSLLNEANAKNLDQIATCSLQEHNDSISDQMLSTTPDQFASLPGQIPSSLCEREKSLQILPTALVQELPVNDKKDPFPDITSSVTNQLSSPPDQITSLQEAIRFSLKEIPIALQVQMPTVTEPQIPSLPEADNLLSDQIPFSVDEDKHVDPKETPTSGPDQILPVLQDQKPTVLGDKTSTFLQEIEGSLTDQSQTSLILTDGSSQDQAQPTLVKQMSTSLQDQTSSLEETENILPGKTTTSLLEENRTMVDQAPSPDKDQNPTLQKAAVLDVLSTSNQDSARPLLDAAVSSENQKVKEGRDDILPSEESETMEIQENASAEQQPLLNKLKTIAHEDISVGDQQQPKTGTPKPQGASVQEVPNYITADGNPASLGHHQPVVSHQGESPEQTQSRRKQKTCQCCLVM